MFGKKMMEDLNYRLVGVWKYDTLHCGIYSKSDTEESITSVETGEQFYSTRDFVANFYGLNTGDDLYECVVYDEESKTWNPLLFEMDTS